MTHDMKRNTQIINMGFTTRKHHTYASQTPYLRGGNSILSCRYLRSLLLIAVMMVGGATGAWGQVGEDRSGVYYIASYDNNNYSATNPANNYYLCLASVYYDGDGYQTSGDMPYLTTDKTGQVSDTKWQVSFAKTIGGVDYYHIKHVETNKYLTLNDSKSTDGSRIRLHLQADLATNGDELFYFTLDTGRGNSLTICPKNDSSGRSLNPAGNNYPGTAATSDKKAKIGDVDKNVGGLIGLYAKNDVRSVWFLEEKVTRPTITYYIGSDQVEMDCSEAGTVIHYTTDGTDPTASSPTYSAAFTIPAGTKSVKAAAVRTADGEVSNVVTLALTATFHVVNKANAVALSYTGTVKDFTATPTEIQSPYIPDAANYKLFSSQAAAYDYSAAATAEARATAAAAATTITTDNQTVYVGYYYDPSDRPSDLPVLDGSKWYQMKHNHGNVANYFYSNLNKNLKPEDSNIASTTSDASITESKYLWHFTGNDPYDIGMANKDMNDRKATSDPGEWLVKQNANISQGWFRTITGYHKDDGASMVMLRYDDSHYNLAILSDDGEQGNYQYLYYFGANGQNNANDYFMRNNKAESPLYVSDRAGCQLSFSSVAAEYTFHIVDTNGRVAISHTVTDQPVGTALASYTDIPEPIRSPYLAGETLTFYSFSGDYAQEHLTAENQITETPLNSADIYVTYTTDHLTDKFLHLRGARVFNMTVNGEYLYDNGSTGSGTLLHESTDVNKADASRLWTFKGGDPYAVQIENAATKNFLAFDTSDGTLSLSADPANKYFILMDGSAVGDGTAYAQMELMAATGTSDFYRIGQSGDALTVSTDASAHDATLQVCTYLTTRSVNYYLIDKANKLIEGPIVSTSTELALPAAWVSPLVATYHYYKAATVTGDTYTVAATDEITSLVDVDGAGNVYVTYDVNTNLLDLDGRNSLGIEGKDNIAYRLRYLNGESFYQENGEDDVMDGSDTRPAEQRQAVYPYSNGDAALYVYGPERWELQLASGASTRSRWLWYIEPTNNPLTKDDLDPYHVKISSYQTQTSYKIDASTTRNFHSYLRTYQPDGYDKIVTGVTNDNPLTTGGSESDPANSTLATEYMILGQSLNQCRLRTLHPVALDLNGDGDTADEGEGNERRTVDSFEMYWKNNPTLQGNPSHMPMPILGVLSAENKVTAVGRNVTLNAAQKAEVEAKGWHIYEEWANSAPWVNNDDAVAEHIDPETGETVAAKAATTGKKYLKEEHAFQTVNMGEELTFEATSLTPQLILIDQHGWEIMRMPLTAAKAEQRKKYNSPMVQEYQWYATASKVPGYHKYIVSGEPQYRKTSLDFTPEGTSISDFYVTYTVLPTFANSYRGAATENATSASSFLLVQDGKYATTNGTTISTTSDTPDMDNLDEKMLWQLLPNFNIDREMGYRYPGETGVQDGALSKPETDQENYDNGMNVFDPYNLQIRSQAYPLRYLTANTTGSALTNGVWTGSTSTLSLQNIGTKQTAAGHDNTSLNITNATFMVVSDGDGSMRLMPRFDHDRVMQEFATFETPLASDHADAAKQNLGFTTTTKEIHSTYDILDMGGTYKLAPDFTIYSSVGTSAKPFTGTIDGQLNTISGTSHALIGYADGATIKNVILDNVSISSGSADGNVGAICNEATGATRIYNCGVLATEGSTINGTLNVGSIVGLLDGTSRVINCYSYATVSGGSMMGGIVGRNNQISTMNDIKTIVVNCMFYGEISGASAGSAFPVYGGNLIDNSGTNAINNYNYFRSDAEFDNVYNNINNYNRSWPAEEKYLTRFEYYRSILNSNRRLCTWWVNGVNGTAPSDADVESVGIAKWVLDTSIAPYPILKKWGKYPSIINPEPVNSLGTLNVTVMPGDHNNSASSQTIQLTITDMDEANHDYGYYKVQLPYYNELFGDPTSNDHATRYGKNYTDMVVTGWDIISATPGTDISDEAGTDADGVAYDHRFNAHWESGYNFADRYCTEKDLFSISGRVFAQGGYYYVPEGVTDITIKAHWGKAVYVRNADNSIDRINVTSAVGSGTEFTPAGKLPSTFQGQTVFTSIQNAITSDSLSNLAAGKTVYDQAVVLVGNIQVRNGSNVVNYSGTNARPYTLMSADFDLDNEPDFCLQLQFRNDLNRPRIQPVRFDFLSVPELGLAIRPDNKAWAIGIMVPAGHFEITETACMHTTQFEYDANISKVEAPVILNGGHFEQIVVRYGSTNNNGVADRTSYFIMGGHFWMKRFTPGAHTNTGSTPKIRHCAVNVIGGEFPEFYLSGIYRTITANVDNPHCYINGGRFGTIAGAGMEQISGDITFKIDHAIIDEFYGGGINASLPVLGKIDVTIDHSRVGKYCGGPKVGILGTTSAYKTVTTHATGTTFGEYYGGGNGGTSYYREKQQDGDAAFPSQSADGWNSYGFSGFNPLNTISGVTKASDNSATNKGYHGEYEFEVFNNSNGTTDQAVVRAYYQWVQFGTTATGKVTNFLKDCTVNGNFYGGGNLGNVNGDVETTLTGDTHITGSAFAAGYSASIPQFRIHDKENATTSNFPARDFAGVITNHTLDYKKDASGNEIYYTWSNELPPGTTSSNAKNNPTFQKGGKWYCYTWESLEGLGAVSGDATITINGNCQIDGNVYGGGDESAVNSDANVTITANAKVLGSVYGGGNIGSVGTYTKADASYHTEHPEVPVGKPITRTAGGKTTVTISGTAEIGHDGMSMMAAGGPSDFGHVFGAGRGTSDPLYNDPILGAKPITDTDKQAKIAELTTAELQGKLDTLEMLAYVDSTEVTISGTAFVKGSVYGGSENGHVLGSTWVKIAGGQIGCGKNTTERFPEEKFASDYVLQDDEDMECASWDYNYPYRPHDIFANVAGYDSRGGYTTATDGHTFFGNVFGGGSGYYPYAPGKWLRTAGRVEGNTKVEVTGGHILTSIYGGNEMTDVGNGLSMETGKGKCEIIMSGGTLGVPRSVSQIQAHPVTCYVFGAGKGDQRTFFNDWTNVNNTEVTIKGTARIYGSVFGGGEDGHVLGDAKVTIEGTTTTTGEGEEAETKTDAPYIGTWGTSYVDGNIFGGGRGFGGDALSAGGVCGNVQIDIKDGTMLGSIYGGGRLGSVGTYLVPPTLSDGTTPNPKYGQQIPDGKQQIVGGADNYEPTDAPGVNHGHITINISGGTIGNDHEYTYYAPGATIDKVADNIPLTEFDYRNHVLYTKGGNVFAGCMGRLDGLDGNLLPHWKDMAKAKTTTLTITGGQIKSNVYGGGELGTLSGGATISITGGSVGTKVGTGETAYYYGSVYGGGKGSTDSRDAANIHIAGQVGGDVSVSLNEGVAGTAKGGIVHQIFGCNDMNGSPLGSVTVNIYKTQNADDVATQIANGGEVTTAKRENHYDVEAVYGGGNLAAYVPTATDAKASVNIYGCHETSIRQVYGGGNAASVPATAVEINGTFEIDEAFGGGNGKDLLPNGDPNPGANVGYKNYTVYVTKDGKKVAEDDPNYDTKEERIAEGSTIVYGSGAANMNIYGGTVHRVYGGSNTKGNVRISAVTMLEEAGCDFSVDEAYGGGKSAPMDAEAKLLMACIPGLKSAYGGAMDAEIEGNVELTITNGTYDRVFGGNNVSGYIHGTIMVNIEETGCKPIIIGQLYGGGNQAPYTAPAGEHGPTLNVRSFTSIGDIFGGGYGESAKVTGDTYVDINVCEGAYKDGTYNYSKEEGEFIGVDSKTGPKTITFTEYKRVYNASTDNWDFVDADDDGERDTETKSIDVYLPPHTAGSIGAINKVYGGGNAAPVDGSTHVSIGTEIDNDVVFKSPSTKTVQTAGAGTPDTSDDVYEEQNTTDAERTHTVVGVKILGNVYGGGNEAEVTGNTDVVIGKRNE